MINIFINEDKIRFEYSKKDGLIQGELKNADEKLSDIIADIKNMKTDEEIKAEENKLKEAEAMTEIFDKMMELEETMKLIQESINKDKGGEIDG
ncbi:hypothetical protein HMPREF9489_0580 [Finegoldia magna SY403409CC001050417]|uniref:Uncharacterized protein n=1 Tax=Finegoldia magna TaxID=1260 RepID=A0A7D4J915_FINMA|nr:hypothetical protein [Finegoldia magna]EGS34244.1 hypothetical protein HMPREF9489_0580 [Finegoldia magna SY403409CC001050417]QKH79740.1 hypothetical protein FOC70_05005 [Finegoldia magna]QKH79777.1 hypothetical protein FOC70_05255 [Finegoldia magna]